MVSPMALAEGILHRRGNFCSHFSPGETQRCNVKRRGGFIGLETPHVANAVVMVHMKPSLVLGNIRVVFIPRATRALQVAGGFPRNSHCVIKTLHRPVHRGEMLDGSLHEASSEVSEEKNQPKRVS